MSDDPIANLQAALASARKHMWKESDRADAAEKRLRDFQTSKLHPSFAVDVQQHRDEAYQTGWDGGYAEGFAKASRPGPKS